MKEDKYVLSQLERIFQSKKHKGFHIPKKGSEVILLLSGGMDSILLWALLMHTYKLHVYPLHISIKKGTKTLDIKQEKSIEYYSKLFKSLYPQYFHKVETIPHEFYFQFNKRKTNIQNPQLIKNNLLFDKFTNRFNFILIGNPTRLSIYSSYAFEYALKLNHEYNHAISSIFFGLVADDTEGVSESTLTMLRAINLVYCTTFQSYEWQVFAPIDKKNNFYFSKKDLLQFAQNNNVDISHSWSCLRNNEKHCGRCASCISRMRSFHHAKVDDATEYENVPQTQNGPADSWFKHLIKTITSLVYRWTHAKKITIKSSSSIAISKHTRWHKEEDTVYLYHTKTHYYESLNPTATHIWSQLTKKPQIVDFLTSSVSSEFGISKEIVRRDVHEFIKKYVKDSFLELQEK